MESAFRSIESKEGMYSLEFSRGEPGADGPQSDARGALVERGGKWWDVAPAEKKQGLDISAMTLEWVNHTEDALFKVYTREERYLLYLMFARDLTLEQIADAMQVPVIEVKNMPGVRSAS
jgi:DNA-directed RNA polymerase specialized sigma24 family protein